MQPERGQRRGVWMVEDAEDAALLMQPVLLEPAQGLIVRANLISHARPRLLINGCLVLRFNPAPLSVNLRLTRSASPLPSADRVAEPPVRCRTAIRAPRRASRTILRAPSRASTRLADIARG